MATNEELEKRIETLEKEVQHLKAIGVIFKAIAKVPITKRMFVASRMFGRKFDLIRILYFYQ